MRSIDTIKNWLMSTVKQRNSSLALLGVLFVLPAFAVTPQTKLLPPAAAELKTIPGKLDPKLLPDGATDLEVENKQIFNLVMQGATQLTLVPVRFNIPVEGSGGTSHNCGAYLLSASGTVSFIAAVHDNLPIQCWSIEAVRLQRIPGENPLIILTGDLNTANRSWMQPFVLRWDKGAGTYKMDTVDYQ
jgi:hypothetical protein